MTALHRRRGGRCDRNDRRERSVTKSNREGRRNEPFLIKPILLPVPAVLRAIFVADWDPGEPRRRFEDRERMTGEVMKLRPDHNYASERAIRDVARVLWGHVDPERLETVLTELPEGAAEFWRP